MPVGAFAWQQERLEDPRSGQNARAACRVVAKVNCPGLEGRIEAGYVGHLRPLNILEVSFWRQW
jgi:hypothetical protein